MLRKIPFVTILLFSFLSTELVHAGGLLHKNPVELSFWHSMSVYQGDTLTRMIDEYNRENEDIRIRPVFQGLYEEMKTKLLVSAKSDNAPDIAQISIEYLDVFVPDIVQPITDRIPEEASSDILPQFWNAVSREREVYAYPFNMSVQVLYYNREAFERAGIDPQKPPKTWDEVIEYGKILTLDFDGDGTNDQWGVLVSLEGVFGFTPLIRQVGGEFLNGNATRALFNSKQGVRVMTLILSMSREHHIMPTSWTLFEGTSAFLEGKIVMGPITCAGIKFAEENLPWELGIAPLPYIQNKSVLLGGAGIAVMTKSPARARAAISFIDWLTSRENCIRWHRETGYLPLRRSAIDSIELQSFHREKPNYRVPIDQLPYARPPDFTPYLPQIDEIIRYAIEDIMINGSPPGKTLDLAADRVNELLLKGG